MDNLLQAAIQYENLLHKDFIYLLEQDLSITVNFQPQHFHHLLGLQKLTDIDQVQKTVKSDKHAPRNDARDIYKNIRQGLISFEDISKSVYFKTIENRLEQFSQINRIVEFEKIIIDFNTKLLGFDSNLKKAQYLLHKQSNTGLYLNLFLGHDSTKPNKQLTFITSSTDQYIFGQKSLKILDLKTISLKK